MKMRYCEICGMGMAMMTDYQFILATTYSGLVCMPCKIKGLEDQKENS